MANDNTMGAPTKGFGQNVTFTFDNQPGANALQGGDASTVGNFGLRGGGTVNAGGSMGHAVTDAGPSGTFSFLSKIADNYIAGKFQEQRTAAYVGGMQQAMQGAAVQDVIKQQPWWSKIFGDSDVVEGARAYTGHATAQLAAAQMMDDMPNMRQMDGPTAKSFFVKKVNDMMTGDTATDLSIQNGLMNALPQVMRTQAKEHYAYTQEQATQAESASFQAGAKNLQALGAGINGKMTSPEDMQQASLSFVQSLVPAVGRDIPNWQTAMTKNLIGAAQQGQFHVLNAAMNTPVDDHGTTAFSTLTPEQQDQVRKAQAVGANDAVKRAQLDYLEPMADIRLMATKPGYKEWLGMTAKDVSDKMLALNKDFQQKTGSPIGLYSGEQIADMREKAGANIITLYDEQAKKLAANAEKSQTLAQKQVDAQNKNQMILSSFYGGTTPDGQPVQAGNYLGLRATPGYSTEDIDYAITQHYKQLDPPHQIAALVANKGPAVGPIAAANDAQVEAALSGGSKEASNSIVAASQKFNTLYAADPATAVKYYPKYAEKMVMFKELQEQGAGVPDAYTMAFVNPIHQQDVPVDTRKQLIAGLTDKYSSWMPFSPATPPATIQFLADKIGTATARWNRIYGDPKMAVKMATQQLDQSGQVEVLGGFGWDASKNPAERLGPWLQKSQRGNVALASDTVDDVVRNGVKGYINGGTFYNADGSRQNTTGIAYDEKVDQTRLQPLKPLADGIPRFQVEAVTRDGHIVRGIMNGNDFFTWAKKQKESDKNSADLGTNYAGG